MTDYISREEAYQFFKDQLEEETGAYSKGRNAGLRVAMSAVLNNDAIPAADVRNVVRGKWTLFGRRGIYGVMYECSACHAKYDGRTNFCPNCGADMRPTSMSGANVEEI